MNRSALPFALILTMVATLTACSQDSPSIGETSTAAPPEQAEEPTQTTNALVATTAYGPVRGFTEDGALVFKGIRYGADTATTRFAPPQPPEPWTEVHDAFDYGNSAPQAQRGRIGLFTSWATVPPPELSEDCLFLNVWTPALRDGGKRPVMVWFHGGGFSTGSGSSAAYDGVRLANRGDAVVVTVNHRLNVFGYLHLDAFGEQFAGSATAGMLDLVASLEWVRDNIEEFGGDPNNVLIFGESGGGFKVSTLMAMDAAQGLFHRAVVQSGPGLTLVDKDQAEDATAALVEQLGLDESTIDQIRTLPAEDIQTAISAIASEGGPVPGGRPVVDGIHIKRHPFTPDAPPQSKDIPLLIGSTRSEMSLLAGARRPELFELTWDTLPDALAQAIPGVDAERVIAGYRELHPGIDAPSLYFEATTDNGVFVRGSFELADRKAAQGGAPVYQYYLTWATPIDGGKWGAPHALDIGFVFDNVAKSESMSGVGEAQQAIADMMSEAWLAFARSGDPNHAGLPDWAPYDAERRATMVFDNEPALVDDPRRREMDLISAALPD
jgi:para-nitrobenzyl esterase